MYSSCAIRPILCGNFFQVDPRHRDLSVNTKHLSVPDATAPSLSAQGSGKNAADQSTLSVASSVITTNQTLLEARLFGVLLRSAARSGHSIPEARPHARLPRPLLFFVPASADKATTGTKTKARGCPARRDMR